MTDRTCDRERVARPIAKPSHRHRKDRETYRTKDQNPVLSFVVHLTLSDAGAAQ